MYRKRCRNEFFEGNGVHYINGQLRMNQQGGITLRFHEPMRRDLITVRHLDSTHPLFDKGSEFGVFALKEIMRGEVLGEYGGKGTLNGDSATSVDSLRYQLTLETITIDASESGNELRFVNDFTGIGSQNVDFVIKYDGSYEFGIIRAVRRIRAGEEILVNYGREYRKAFLFAAEEDYMLTSSCDSPLHYTRSPSTSADLSPM